MRPKFWQELNQHTFKMIYHLEGALHVITLKSTHHVTSFFWKKSVLLIRAHQGQVMGKWSRHPTLLPSDKGLSEIIEKPYREA